MFVFAVFELSGGIALEVVVYTYGLIGIVFLLAVGLLDWFWGGRVVRRRGFWVVATVLMCLTALFDPWLATHPVGYDGRLNLGVCWFGAPIEDVCYTLSAVWLMGTLIARDMAAKSSKR